MATASAGVSIVKPSLGLGLVPRYFHKLANLSDGDFMGPHVKRFGYPNAAVQSWKALSETFVSLGISNLQSRDLSACALWVAAHPELAWRQQDHLHTDRVGVDHFLAELLGPLLLKRSCLFGVKRRFGQRKLIICLRQYLYRAEQCDRQSQSNESFHRGSPCFPLGSSLMTSRKPESPGLTLG